MANSNMIHQISGSVKNPDQFSTVIEAITGCRYFAYIYHDSDLYEPTDDKVIKGEAIAGTLKSRHLHFIAEDRHSLRVWSKLLDIPENMIEIPRNFRSVNRYLIHKDHPQKFQYASKDIVCNRPTRLESYLDDNQDFSPIDLYKDMYKMKKRIISKEDFLEKYKFFIYKQSFLSQYKILTDLINNYD